MILIFIKVVSIFCYFIAIFILIYDKISKNMINIKNKLLTQQVFFPKMAHLPNEEYEVTFKSEMTKKEITLFLTDVGGLADYYVFNLNFKDFEDGEWEYKIGIVETGLIRIGELDKDKTQYNNKQEYKQYNG